MREGGHYHYSGQKGGGGGPFSRKKKSSVLGADSFGQCRKTTAPIDSSGKCRGDSTFEGGDSINKKKKKS